MKHEFRGKEIVVTYDSEVCSHSGNCVRGLLSVFDTTRDPWIAPDAASADAVEATVRTCPSGALQTQRA